MVLRNRFARTIAIAVLVGALTMAVALGQLPIPVQGQRGGGQAQQGVRDNAAAGRDNKAARVSADNAVEPRRRRLL